MLPSPLVGTYIYPTKVLCMLSQLPPFCNSFPKHAISVWQGAWTSGRCRGYPHRVAVVWSTLDLASPAHIPRSLHAGRTPIHLSITNPHIIRTYSPTKRSAACMWRTPLAISLCNHDASIRRQHPYSLARAAAYLYSLVALQRSSWSTGAWCVCRGGYDR